MTTIASSTTIPSAKIKANITSIFIVKPIKGRTRYAMAIDKGTAKATNIAFTIPMKNIRTMITKRNPRIIVLFNSFTVFLV